MLNRKIENVLACQLWCVGNKFRLHSPGLTFAQIKLITSFLRWKHLVKQVFWAGYFFTASCLYCKVIFLVVFYIVNRNRHAGPHNRKYIKNKHLMTHIHSWMIVLVTVGISSLSPYILSYFSSVHHKKPLKICILSDLRVGENKGRNQRSDIYPD